MTVDVSSDVPLLVFVHGSAEMYGSDKVLLHLASAAARGGEFRPLVMLHEDGALRVALAAAGVEVHVGTVIKITRGMLSPAGLLTLAHLMKAAIASLDRAVGGRPVAAVHSNTLAVLGGALWARRRGHPHLWHVHEIILQPALVSRALPWLADKLSRRVIANSVSTQRWLLGRAPRLAGRSVVVFNGLPEQGPADRAAAASFRARIGAGADDTVVTVAGRLNHWKGQGLLIDAFAELQRSGRLGRLRLAIVGSVFAGHDDVRAALVSRVAAHGLVDRVAFVDFVADIAPVWHGSQIAVVPSIEPEPFGMVAIEAMACALPVIAAAHGGLLDIVVDRETGLLVEPRNACALADAVAALAADPALCSRYGMAGARRQQALFSVREQVASTRAVWRDVAGMSA